MTTPPATVLVVGATGSIGRLVVEEAIRHGYTTRALVRDPGKARRLPSDADVIVGDVTRPDTLPAAVIHLVLSVRPSSSWRRPARHPTTSTLCSLLWTGPEGCARRRP